jgi:hypothetical protein
MNFVNRPKTILLAFLKAFFSQKRLFKDIDNEFIYTDGVSDSSLTVRVSYSTFDENINSFPCIVLQEGGFQEEMRGLDNRNSSSIFDMEDYHISSFSHPITIHCLTANKGSSELLQALVSRAIISFRKSIYEMGIDHITPINGMPTQMMSSPAESTAQYFDSAITFAMHAQQNWFFTSVDNPEEIIKISLISALNELEYDIDGNILSDSLEYFSQNIKIDL